MGEHDDELDAAPRGRASDDAARIADAIAIACERLARAIEHGLAEVADALRERPKASHRRSARP